MDPAKGISTHINLAKKRKSQDLQRPVISIQVLFPGWVADGPEEKSCTYFPRYFVTCNEQSPQHDWPSEALALSNVQLGVHKQRASL